MKYILAFTDSINTCECCNKNNLKGTYAVADDLGNEFYYGSTCVLRNLGYTKTDLQKDLNKTKSKAQWEYSEIKDEIKLKNLDMIQEKQAFNNAHKLICKKYHLKFF